MKMYVLIAGVNGAGKSLVSLTNLSLVGIIKENIVRYRRDL